MYAVNSKGIDVSGLKAYRDIKEIPGPIDYAVCCIPAPAVPQFILDSAEKKVKVVSVFTAGFSESGKPEGMELEQEIARLCKKTGVRVIGPNCLGAYVPSARFSFTSDFPKEPGSVAFACQSGGNSVYTTRAAGYRGVRFSKVISYGNACDINECELLEYFAKDPETKIVALYIEGPRDGRRLAKVLRELCGIKPVVVLKGGYTRAGSQTAASHTGSLAGYDAIWDDLLAQAGAIRVYNLEELVDVLVTLYFLSDVKGNKVGIFGGGGGASVLGTDDWASNGFELPPLPEVFRNELRSSVPTDAGLILSNPLDLSSFAYSDKFYNLVKRLLTTEGYVDLSVIHIGFGQAAWFSTETFEAEINFFRDAVMRIRREVDRPLALVMQYLITGYDWQKGIEGLQIGCAEAGIPVYHSMAGAARAISLVLRSKNRRRAGA